VNGSFRGGCCYADIRPGSVNSNTHALSITTRCITDNPEILNTYLKTYFNTYLNRYFFIAAILSDHDRLNIPTHHSSLTSPYRNARVVSIMAKRFASGAKEGLAHPAFRVKGWFAAQFGQFQCNAPHLFGSAEGDDAAGVDVADQGLPVFEEIVNPVYVGLTVPSEGIGIRRRCGPPSRRGSPPAPPRHPPASRYP